MNLPTNLISTKAIGKSFNQLVALQRDVPFSLIFYTMIQANAQPCQKLPKDFPDHLPANLRQFICVKWDETKNEWRFNRDKADKLREKFDFEFNATTFETLVDIIDSHLLSKSTVVKTDEQKVKTCETSLLNTVSKLLELGLSSEEIEVKLKDIILKAQKGNAKVKTVTATA
jgi:hypothetical protein